MEKHVEDWVLEGAVPVATEQPKAADTTAEAAADANTAPLNISDDDDLEIVEPAPVAPSIHSSAQAGKRSAHELEEGLESRGPSKRPRA